MDTIPKMRSKKLLIKVWPYILALVLCLAILAWVMRLWNADLSVPFVYGGDTLFGGTGIKGVIENGWYLHNPSVGMPSGLFLNDYPGTDMLNWLVIKLLTLFTSNWAVVLNMAFLIAFPLTTLATMYVLRQLRFSIATSIVISLLYTFIPYHFFRGEAHLFLASYYMIPLVILVALRISSGESVLFKSGMTPRLSAISLRNPDIIFTLVITILVAMSGIYYSLFALFFIFLAGVIAYIRHQKTMVIWTTGILMAVILAVIALNVSPYVIFRLQHGANKQAAVRNPTESEIYGLKVTQLLLPVSGHRILILARYKAIYDRLAPLNFENGASTLGVFGSLGFLFLIVWFLLAKGREPNDLSFRLYDLSLFNISAILLSTIAGFGAVFSLGLTALHLPPMIRAWNRISIYIAFFSLIAVALGLEYISRYLKRKRLGLVFILLAGAVVTMGILDQTTDGFIPDYQWAKAEYKQDGVFVKRIESSVPEGSMIFQLPYIPFPENPPVNKMGDYELFRGYLHSKSLRWSYGAMKGREGDAWQKQVSSLSVEAMLSRIAAKGFNGVYIDRYGYKDNGKEIEKQIKGVLKTESIVSNNGRLVFFKI